MARPSGIPSDSRESASVADGGLSEASPCDQAPAGASRFPAGPPTSGAHPINASRNCASFGADRGIRERGAPHLTVMATPLSPDLRRGAPRSVELRCEAFVFFPSVDFYSRPREMRSGELPRLRPPRVESWRARRGGLEVRVRVEAWPDFDDHQPLITITCAVRGVYAGARALQHTCSASI